MQLHVHSILAAAAECVRACIHLAESPTAKAAGGPLALCHWFGAQVFRCSCAPHTSICMLPKAAADAGLSGFHHCVSLRCCALCCSKSCRAVVVFFVWLCASLTHLLALPACLCSRVCARVLACLCSALSAAGARSVSACGSRTTGRCGATHPAHHHPLMMMRQREWNTSQQTAVTDTGGDGGSIGTAAGTDSSRKCQQQS